MVKKSEEALQRVYCRDCYRAVAFVGNGCFCRHLMQRVCAAEKYGHPITFCRGGYLDKSDARTAKYKDGEVFHYRGKAYKAVMMRDFRSHCFECGLNYYCRRDPNEIDKVVGLCRGMYFEKL